MGVSTNAYLVFGVTLDEYDEDREPDFLQGCEDFDGLLADDADLPPWRDDMTEAESDEYFRKERAIVAAAPVDLVSHCSGEFPMWIMAVRGTQLTACRGDPTTVDPATLQVDPDRIKAAAAWCKAKGIEWEDPQWILCSDWC